MKRKVRVTPPASNPFESNPMSTWMAQMGGAQMSPEQPTEEEHIYSIAAEMLSQGFPEDEVKTSLVNNGFSAPKVNELVDSLVAYVDEQRDLTEAQYLEDKDAEEQLLMEQEAAERAAMEEEATRNAMYDSMYYAESDPGYAEEDAVMQEVLMKFGGKVPTKKQYVKKALQLKKKQEGGQDQQVNRADDTFSQKRPLSDFVSSVAQTAQQKADEEMFAQEYDDYFGTDESLDEAQWGGARGQRRMMRQANRMMRRIPAGFMAPGQMFPPQFNIMTAPTLFPMANTFAGQMQMPGNIQMANIEVRRTGLFGRPKEYTINFNTTPPNQIKPEEIVTQEKQNAAETLKEEAAKEKEKETTTASTENEKVQEELVTADQITVSDGKGTTPKKPAGNSTEIAKVDSDKPQVKKDKWGRPEGSAWYGFNPETKKYEDEYKKDQWGRPATSEWYGFDPKTKKFTTNYRDLGIGTGATEYYYPTRMENAYYKVGDKWYVDNKAYGTDPTGKKYKNWWGEDSELNNLPVTDERGNYAYASSPDEELYEITDPKRIAELNKNAVKFDGSKSGTTYGYDPYASKGKTPVTKNNKDFEAYLINEIPKQKGGSTDAWGRSADSAWYGFDPKTNKFTVKDQFGRPPGSKWYGYDPEGEWWIKGSKAGSIPKNWAQGSLPNDPGASLNPEYYNEKGEWAPNPNYYNEEGGQTGMGLYHFVYGGDEVPFADQSFMYGSKDVTDPYFQPGGPFNINETTNDIDVSDQDQTVPAKYAGKYFHWAPESWDNPEEKYWFTVGDRLKNIKSKFTKDDKEPKISYQFSKGGLTKAQAGYWKNGEWVEGMYPGDEKELNTESPTVNMSENPNRKRYDALKELGYNVGDYREGIDYTKINTQRNQTQQQQTNPMYNPAIGAMYPPVFGARRFRPAGRAIEYAGSWAQQKGLPFDPRTGKPIMGLPSSTLPLTKIDVTKSSLFGKRPKEYTMYFGNYGQQPTAGTNKPGAQNTQVPTDARNFTRFQNFLLKTPLSKFVDTPKGDLITDGFVSPKDITTISSLPTKRPTEITSPAADELRSRALAELDGAPSKLPVRPPSMISPNSTLGQEPIQRNFAINNQVPAPYFTDEELAEQNQLVDVQPEDLSQEYTPMPGELAVNRNPEVVSPMVNTAGPMADMNYSYDMPGEGENYPEEYEEPFSPERNYMLESLGRDSSNLPYYPSFTSESPVVGPQGMADYLSGALNYNMDLPYQPEAPQPWMTQQMVDESNKRYQERQAAIKRKQERERAIAQEEARKQETVKPTNVKTAPISDVKNTQIVSNNAGILEGDLNESYYDYVDKQDLYEDPETGMQYDKLNPAFRDANGNFSQKKFDEAVSRGRAANKKQQEARKIKEKENTERLSKLYKEAGFPTQYVNNPNKMSKWLNDRPETMLYWIMEEPQSLYMQGWKTEDILRMRKEYAKWAYENGINNEYAKEYSKGTYTRKQQGGLHKAQAGVNQNSVNNQDESDIPYLKPISSKEAWAKSEPEIRKAWGLESPKLEVSEPDPYAVKYKNKDMYNVDFERLVNQFNTGANMALNWFGQRGDREREQQMFDNLTADNLYTSTNDYNRGTYDPNSGLFRQDLGFKGVIQKGGSTYKEGGETYMSAKQIAEFIANGGEIEFI